ncbi:hypothetical protein J0X19_13235 [Hymenobacter sp. BT186]|uniref:DUF3298 domain-containing protein n=1 Tax=Hymenobacter telluris TaxID=2816474 RepID=A0A939JD11_9BACT|nr:hypothetical protein [Hymenobacter telluris]MBO0358915.1 hypothetical protein [Hymenobacter telluris]MBW3374941.1 hypothetical protein [Hymenobacter norwichensis]
MYKKSLRWLLPLLLLVWAAEAQQRPVAPKPAAVQQRPATPKKPVRRPAVRPKTTKPAPKPVAPKLEQAVVVSVSDTIKRRFIVPQVQMANAAVAARINLGLADAALGEDLEDVPQPLTALAAIEQAHIEFEAGKSGFTESRYEVLYNDHNLLSVECISEYLGAYPSTVRRHATFDLRTGRLLEVRDLIADTVALRQRWQQSINRRVTEHLRTLPNEYPQLTTDSVLLADVKQRLYWNDSLHAVELLPEEPRFYDFALTPFGLMLYYDFGFPHVIQALQPDLNYQFLYADLKPWLKPKGPLEF